MNLFILQFMSTAHSRRVSNLDESFSESPQNIRQRANASEHEPLKICSNSNCKSEKRILHPSGGKKLTLLDEHVVVSDFRKKTFVSCNEGKFPSWDFSAYISNKNPWFLVHFHKFCNCFHFRRRLRSRAFVFCRWFVKKKHLLLCVSSSRVRLTAWKISTA